MARAFRRVPPDWAHPRDADGEYIPLFDKPGRRPGYRQRVWSKAEATAYQYYEETTEGTPISPVCLTLDEMARWFLDHECDQGVLRWENGGYVREPWTYEQVVAYIQQGEW